MQGSHHHHHHHHHHPQKYIKQLQFPCVPLLFAKNIDDSRASRDLADLIRLSDTRMTKGTKPPNPGWSEPLNWPNSHVSSHFIPCFDSGGARKSSVPGLCKVEAAEVGPTCGQRGGKRTLSKLKHIASIVHEHQPCCVKVIQGYSQQGSKAVWEPMRTVEGNLRITSHVSSTKILEWTTD